METYEQWRGHRTMRLGAGLAQFVTVLAREVEFKMVVGMLDHRNTQIPCLQQWDELAQQGGFAGAAVSAKAENGYRSLHCWSCNDC